jgi:hypothetical protein
LARCRNCETRVWFRTTLCKGCEADLAESYKVFLETHNPRAMQTYGLLPLNYFLLITKIPMPGSGAGTSGPCIAVSEFGMSAFDGRNLAWNYVGADDVAMPLIVRTDLCGLVQLSPGLKDELEKENAFIGLPPDLIQGFIDQGLAKRVRD